MASQVSILGALDAKAAALLAAAVTLTGIALTVAFALLESSTSLNLRGPAIGAALGAASATLLSAVMALSVLWPTTQTELSGWMPLDFEDDWEKQEDQVLEKLIREAQDRILANNLTMGALLERANAAVFLLFGALPFGLVGAMWGASLPWRFPAGLTTLLIFVFLAYCLVHMIRRA